MTSTTNTCHRCCSCVCHSCGYSMHDIAALHEVGMSSIASKERAQLVFVLHICSARTRHTQGPASLCKATRGSWTIHSALGLLVLGLRCLLRAHRSCMCASMPGAIFLLSIYPSIHESIYLSVHLSTCLSISIAIAVAMGHWIDGWMDGSMDGWIDGRMDGCVARQTWGPFYAGAAF